MNQLVTVILFSKNFEESIQFYCKWLGFNISYDWNKPNDERIVRLQNTAHNLEISLRVPQSEWEKQLIGKQSGSSPFFSLGIKGLEDLCKSLLKEGAPFSRALVQPPFGDFAYLKDPDGNEIGLVEYWIPM
jgi:catechol 2,3-dioxygenase-like lactoylglutathione lyase family enzyme